MKFCEDCSKKEIITGLGDGQTSPKGSFFSLAPGKHLYSNFCSAGALKGLNWSQSWEQFCASTFRYNC